MRQISCLLVVLALTVAATFAFPASYEKESDTSDDAEFIVVPLSQHRPTYFNRFPSTSFEGFDGVVDTGDFAPIPARPVYFPTYNPFSWHLSGYLDDLMRRVRDRFAGSWNPFYGGDYIPSGPDVWPVDIPEDSSEDGATNSTSTVKVIDGHKVVINDTYYTKKTDFGTSIFKVRVIDVKPVDEGKDEGKEDTPKPEAPTDVDVANRNGDDDEKDKEPAPTTEASTRDTELESSDEEKSPADDDDNAIDTSDVDIDEAKSKDKEPLTEKSESKKDIVTYNNQTPPPTRAIRFVQDLTSFEQSSEQWSGLESFEGPSASLVQDERQPTLAQRNRDNSELLDSSSEEVALLGENGSGTPLSDEWPRAQEEGDSRRRIIVPVIPFDRRFSANQERPADEDASPPAGHDLSNDIAINFRLATDPTITANPNAIIFDPSMEKPTVFVQSDPFPAPAPGRFPAPNGQRPTMGFPSPQQPSGPGGPVFPMVGVPFPGFPAGGQFPVQPFPVQPALFGPVPAGPGSIGRPNFGFPQTPQQQAPPPPPFFFGNGQAFGRP